VSDKAADAADLLAATSHSGGTIDGLPDALRPGTPAEAMAIQSAFIRRHGSCGWKVGPHPSGSGWCGAPLRGRSAQPTPHRLSYDRAAAMRIEVEVAIVLGSDLPAAASAADVRTAIAKTHIALELFRSSYPDPKQQDFPSLLADSLSNAGVVLGEGRAPREGDDFGALEMTLVHNGDTLAGTGKGAAMDVIVEMLGWLSGYAAEVGSGLKRGDVIITGARLGPLSVAEAGTYRASCALGGVELEVA